MVNIILKRHVIRLTGTHAMSSDSERIVSSRSDRGEDRFSVVILDRHG